MHPLLPPTPSLPTPGPRSSSRRDPGCASQPPPPGDGEPTTRTAWHPDGLCGEEEEEEAASRGGVPTSCFGSSPPSATERRSSPSLRSLLGRGRRSKGPVTESSFLVQNRFFQASWVTDCRSHAMEVRCTRETTPTSPALLRRWPILPPLRHRCFLTQVRRIRDHSAPLVAGSSTTPA